METEISTKALLAAATSDGATQIPLIFIQSGKMIKIGIKVGVSIPHWNDGQTVTRIYEFDTGGKGFWLDSGQYQTDKVESLGPVQTLYTSGNYYGGIAAKATVSFPDAIVPNSATVPSIQAKVGLITTYVRYPEGSVFKSTNSTSTNSTEVVSRKTGKQVYPTSPTFPIFEECYGDFGASLCPTDGMPGEANSVSMLGVLSQFVSAVKGLDPGFVVSVPRNKNDQGWVILGVGDNLRKLFGEHHAISMNVATPPTFTLLDGANVNTFLEQAINAALTVVPPDKGQEAEESQVLHLSNVGMCLDTGCPHVVMHGGTVLTVGNNEPANYGVGVLTIKTKTGDILVNEAVDYSAMQASKISPPTPGYVNTGVQNFIDFQVMYDITKLNLYFARR